MKKTKIVKWNIDIDAETLIQSSTNASGVVTNEYEDFIDTLMYLLNIHNYELYNQHDSNREYSNSHYFTYFKFDPETEVEIKLIVNIRVSDHENIDRVQDGVYETGLQRRNAYIQQQVKDLSKDWAFSKKFKSVRFDIIFDNIHYQSYDDALDALRSKLDELDQRYFS